MVARTAIGSATESLVVEEPAAGAVAAGQTVDVGRQPGVAAAVGRLKVAARPRSRCTVRVP